MSRTPLLSLLFLAACLPLFGTGCATPTKGFRFVAAYRSADPVGLAVSPDERRGYIAQGAELLVLDLEAEGEQAQLLARFPLDLAVISMEASQNRLFIAGGAQGLWSWSGEGGGTLTPLEQSEGLVCTAVAMGREQILACFIGAAGPQLRSYRRDDFTLLQSVKFAKGQPFSITLDGERAYLAMGAAGVVRVSGLGNGEPQVEWGPDLGGLPVVPGFDLRAGYARDLAAAHGKLYVAADASGLLSLDLSEPWGSNTSITRLPTGVSERVLYALRVATQGDSVAVGYGRGPAQAIDGAPYSSFGVIGGGLEPGGIDPDRYVQGKVDLLEILHVASGLEKQSVRLPLGGWTELILGERGIHALHLVHGFVSRDRKQPERVRTAFLGEGMSPIDGVVSRIDPQLVLFGSDYSGIKPVNLLRFHPDTGSVEGLAIPSFEPFLGLQYDAHWVDPEHAGREWLVGGYGLHACLIRVDHGPSIVVNQWPLPFAVDPKGQRGDTYFNSRLHGDLLLLTCVHTEFGLLGYSAAELMEEARGKESGIPLGTPAKFRLRTHMNSSSSHFTYRTHVASVPDGRQVACVVTGKTTLSGKSSGSLLLLDVSQGVGDTPRVLNEFTPPGSAGHLLAVQAGRFGDRTLVFVGGLDGTLSAYDISIPERVTLVDQWSYSGQPLQPSWESVLDLELWKEPTGTGYRLLVAMGRLGWAEFALPANFEAWPVPRFVDTPGWAAGLYMQDRTSTPHLFVGDQKAGLRIYSWTEID